VTRAAPEDPVALCRALVAEGRALHPAGDVPMVLATADAAGNPSARYVLLKEIDAGGGFVFYTNAHSRKGRELAARPRAALVLYWPALGQQLRVEGAVEEVDPRVADAYWATRPFGSRLGTLASDQSAPLESRAALEERAAALRHTLAGAGPPRPAHWTGFRLLPDAIELWKHRDDRLHERALYRREAGATGGWRVTLLQP
jgi:pyridoxamine 5'-phosphate oxidase